MFGGDDTPSTGFAFGFDRLAELFPLETDDLKGTTVVVVLIRARNGAQDVAEAAVKIASRLRVFFPTHVDVMRRSLSAQLAYANSINASFAVLVGAKELKEGKVTVRNLDSGAQEKIGIEDCVEQIKARFGD